MKLEKIIAARTNKTVYRDGAEAIKVFDSDFSKSNILNEALNQARAEETGLHVPKVLRVTDTDDGRWAIVSEYIEGKTLDRLMKENPDKFGEYLELMVELQIKMHAKTAPLMNRMKDRFTRKIGECELAATVRYDLLTRLESMPKHNKVCHGDFCPENIIIAKDGTPYILDWSHASQGNASADVARTYLLFWLNGNIDGAKKYLELFCKKSNTAKQYVQAWMPIVAAARLASANAKEQEFLLSWVNVSDYE